jgi:hypothetical protein
MKKKSTKLHLMLMLVCLLAVTTLKAQTVLSTTNVYCLSSTVTMKANLDAAAVSYIWKRYNTPDATGPSTIVAGQNTAILTDGPLNTPGYYSYVATAVNADGCTSEVSTLIVVYVLPGINAAITASVDAAHQHYCTTDVPTGANAIVLSATGSNAQPGLSETFAYNYQWFKDGVAITTNGTSPTYTLTAPFDAAVGPKAYTVKLTYQIKPTCDAGTSLPITITVNDVPGKPVITITP